MLEQVSIQKKESHQQQFVRFILNLTFQLKCLAVYSIYNFEVITLIKFVLIPSRPEFMFMSFSVVATSLVSTWFGDKILA